MTLSIIILTRDEERHIRDCLASVRDFADELLVFDSGSLDRTVEIAREMGARVEARPFDDFAKQRNAAIAAAHGDWIFFIDADERATKALGQEIRFVVENCPSSVAGFWIARRNVIFGKEIKYTGWSPDYQPRILRKGRGRFDPTREVHELIVWDGETRNLREPLIHFNYDTLAQFRRRNINYTRYEARIWFEAGKRARWRGLIGQPLREFWRRYIILSGWKDGAHGLLLSVLMAYYALVRWKMLRRMQGQPLGGRISL
ncbi:MAG: glycosyltransferase family 2 protein [Chloroflexi bacterium]|nr:glycosyltransferase family 2 protein [Chloroflexota bacterium]